MKHLLILCALPLMACGAAEEADSVGLSETSLDSTSVAIVEDSIPEVQVPVFEAVIDSVAMAQATQWTEQEFDNAIQLYNSGKDEYMVWSDKMRGRCGDGPE